MKDITIAIGKKENIMEDTYTLARKWVDNPEIVIVTGKDIKNVVIENASALFIGENLVLVLLDPERALIEEMKEQLQALKERIHIIIYTTAKLQGVYKPIEGNTVIMEGNIEKRIEDRVRNFIRKYKKKMTHEGLKLLTKRIKDESILEPELMKLVNYVGDRKEIKSKDVLSIVTETHEENLTALFEALASTDKKETLYIFENLLLNGLHILAIHSYLVRQVRLLLQAKDMEEVFKAGSEYDIFLKTFHKWKESLEFKPSEKKHYLPYQNPYFAYKLSKTSQKISRKDLIAFLDTLVAFDINVKRGTKYDRIHMEHGLLEA
jgi:DNA polymerase III delta subunit